MKVLSWSVAFQAKKQFFEAEWMSRRELAAAMAEHRMADQDCSWNSMPPETFIPAWHAHHVHPLQKRERGSLTVPSS